MIYTWKTWKISEVKNMTLSELTFNDLMLFSGILIISQLIIVLVETAIYFNNICKEDDQRLKILSTYHKHVFDMFDVNQYKYKSKKQ